MYRLTISHALIGLVLCSVIAALPGLLLNEPSLRGASTEHWIRSVRGTDTMVECASQRAATPPRPLLPGDDGRG